MANEQLVETVADVIEDAAEDLEVMAQATRRLTGREVGFFTIGAGIGLAIGSFMTYKIVEKRLTTKYEKIANEAIDEMRQRFYEKEKARIAKDKPDIAEVVKERHEIRFTKEEWERNQAAINEVAEMEEAEETTQVNVFEAQDQWDFQYEISQRTKHVPYIIHYTEFEENAPEHDQTTYTYYEMDDVLADTRDTVIDDMDKSIGLGNLGRWGHGSNDPNTVHIRNEELGLDVEVVRDPGSWSDTVNKSIRHSADRVRRPRRRFDDDEDIR